MNKAIFFFSNILVAIMLFGCEAQVDTSGIKDEIKARKIKKISKGELLAASSTMADTLLTKHQPAQLKNDLYEIKVEEIYSIKYVPIDQIQTLSGVENETYEAYQYNISNGLPIEDYKQFVDNENFILYCRPLIENNLIAGVWFVYLQSRYLVNNIQG